MSSTTVVWLVAISLIAVIIYYIKVNYIDTTKKGEKKAVPYSKGTHVIDFINRVDQPVESVKVAGEKRIVKYKDGTVVNYDDNSFELLNIDDVLIGKPCIFTYGTPYDKEKVIKIKKEMQRLKHEIAILRAKSQEDKKREIENIKEVTKKQRRDIE